MNWQADIVRSHSSFDPIRPLAGNQPTNEGARETKDQHLNSQKNSGIMPPCRKKKDSQVMAVVVLVALVENNDNYYYNQSGKGEGVLPPIMFTLAIIGNRRRASFNLFATL